MRNISENDWYDNIYWTHDENPVEISYTIQNMYNHDYQEACEQHDIKNMLINNAGIKQYKDNIDFYHIMHNYAYYEQVNDNDQSLTDYKQQINNELKQMNDTIRTNIQLFTNNVNNVFKHYDTDKTALLNKATMLIDAYGYHNNYDNILEYSGFNMVINDKMLDDLCNLVNKMLTKATGNNKILDNSDDSNDKIDFMLTHTWFQTHLINSVRVKNSTNKYSRPVKTMFALYDTYGKQYCEQLLSKCDCSYNDYNTALYIANGNVDAYNNAVYILMDNEMQPFRNILTLSRTNYGVTMKVLIQMIACAYKLLQNYNGDLTVKNNAVNDKLLRRLKYDKKLIYDNDKNGIIMDATTARIISDEWEKIAINKDYTGIANMSGFIIAYAIKYYKSRTKNNDSMISNLTDDDIINYANNYVMFTTEYADEIIKTVNDGLYSFITSAI